MLLKNKKVAVIGAGPVGLTMARLLQQAGIDVTVYERDRDAQTRIWGGTLDLHKGSGQDALQKAGLLESYYALAIPMGRTIADEQGHVLFSKKPAPEELYDNPEINRNELRKMLLNSLASNTVVWDRKLTELEEKKGKWQLQFEKGPAATADLVIGANGGMSGVRKWVTDAAVEYTGTFIIQGDVLQPDINCPAFYQLCGGNILMVAGKGNLLVANPRNNNILSYIVTFRKEEDWLQNNNLNFADTGSIAVFLSDMLSSWHACYKELFSATTPFWGLPARKLPLDEPWKNDRPLPVTLIGDAAHLMPPFAGQGVNTGLLDATILFDNLTNGQHETIQAAISDYERQMMAYAAKAQTASTKNETEMHRTGFSFQEFVL
ncbi:MAG: FAD-dependent monooxygenase [Williamsia sp.]|nr:FAD-dependent monooxygenase [Williamsia sp.]